MNVDEIVRKFQQFLEASWQSVESALPLTPEGEHFRLDWLQTNWEILVEAVIYPGGTSFLEFYGEGAECNGASSRVWNPAAKATHRICCVPKDGSEVTDLVTGSSIEPQDLDFFGFGNWDGKWYVTQPPFNVVVLDSREGVFRAGRRIVDVFIVRLEEVRFEIQALDPYTDAIEV